jgi:hypothetical protein
MQATMGVANLIEEKQRVIHKTKSKIQKEERGLQVEWITSG